jgi:tRNA modification GTPase
MDGTSRAGGGTTDVGEGECADSGSSPQLPDWALGTERTGTGTHFTVLNKVDLLSSDNSGGEHGRGGGAPGVMNVSCVTQEGVEEFMAALQAAVEARVSSPGAGGCSGEGSGEVVAITRLRHRHRLAECVGHLGRFVDAAAASTSGGGGEFSAHSPSSLGMGHEIAAEELRLAARALGHVTGHVDVEELLDVIFADFCIGK